MPNLQTDPEQISTFVETLFAYASEGGFVSLRAFDDRDKGKRPFAIEPVQIDESGLAPVKDCAATLAERCATAVQAIVFCPPVVTFKDATNARADNVAEGLELSVDCDQTPVTARSKLESLLGPATIVVASGGEWTDPETGELQDKLHLHWRLNKPTQTNEYHALLRKARALATKLVGGDDTNAALVHPIRWPGSVHRKGEPRLARIVSLNADAEIDLGDALEVLKDAAGAGVLSECGSQSLSARATATTRPPAGAAFKIDTGGEQSPFWGAVNDAAMADLDSWAPALFPMARKHETGAWRIRSADLGRDLQEDLSIHPNGITDFGEERGLNPIGTVMHFGGMTATEAAHWLCERLGRSPEDFGWRELATGGGENSPMALQPHHQTAFSFVQVASLKYRPPEYVIEGLLETDTLGLIFGDPGCGKSFLAVDLGLSVASGAPFHGRKVKQGPVFFIAGEGHNGLARRFAAWSNAREVPLAGVPLFKSERAAQFLDGSSAEAVADAVGSLASHHGPPALIIIDTLARNFGAGDENNTKDMSEFVVAIDDLKARFPGSSVLIVHHSGHAEKQRARGAMALKGALDTEYRVEKDGNLMRLVNTKMKDAEPPQDVFFEFKPVDLGDAQSAVLETTDAPERKHRLTPTQQMALQTYLAAAIDHGVWCEGAFTGVHVSDWRDQFYKKHTGDSIDAKKKAFQRVRKDLVETGQLAANDDIYLATDSKIQLDIFAQRDMRDTAGQEAKCPDAEAGSDGTNGTNA